MTLEDYVKLFKKPAYLFKNGFTGKYQYFIPFCDYDYVVEDEDFDQSFPTVVIHNGKIICSIQKLMRKAFLEGDEHLFIVPVTFDKEPVQKKIDVDESFSGKFETDEESITQDDENS